ncbi:MAG: hypothetical protein GVY32_08400 [Gammaproteobacteria bacterium]|nr:hypothetical protein [Gammaproteobacteria bacterium]
MKIAAGTAVLLMLAWSFPAAGEDRPGCLIAPGDLAARSASDGPAMIDLPGGPAGVEPSCSGLRLEGVAVRLPLGSRHDITLHVRTGQGDWRALDGEGRVVGWVGIDASRRHPDSVVVSIRSPREGVPGERSDATLVFEPASVAEDILTIPVELELVEEAPMFRDEFDVDPVIGQFSLVY